MKNKIATIKNRLWMLGLFFLAILAVQCTDNEAPEFKAPSLVMEGSSNETRNSAVLTGTIYSNGSNYSDCGFFYSRSASDLEKNMLTSGTLRATKVSVTPDKSGEMKTIIQNLNAGTTYYFCMYATSGKTMILSEVQDFETPKESKPELNSVEVLDFDTYTITVRSSIKDKGGASLTSFGFEYRKVNETQWKGQNTNTFDEGSDNTFTMTLKGLEANTEYIIRATASNGVGSNESEEVSQRTAELKAPVVRTQDVAEKDLGSNWVKVMGNIQDKGASDTIVARGFCYSINNQEPTITDNRATVDTKENEFSKTITGLIPNSTYYLRAYAANKVDGVINYGYGNVIVFTTYEYKSATFGELKVSDVTASTATVTCTVTPGTADIERKGFCYSNTSDKPTLEHTSVSVDGESNEMKITLEELDESKTYYIRAFVTSKDADGKEETIYGDIAKIETLAYKSAAFEKIEVNDVEKHTAKVSTVLSEGTTTINEKGFCWRKNDGNALTVTSYHGKQKIESGEFIVTLDGLDYGTNYTVCAYAICKRGTKEEVIYSTKMNFTTESYKVPSFSALATDSITKTSAILSAKLDAGEATITEKGFCWSTSNSPTTENSKMKVEGDELKASITGLNSGTTYYYRAYIVCKFGEKGTEETRYSSSAYFKTESYKVPSISIDVTDITLNSAKLSATMDSTKSDKVTIIEKGFIWSTTNSTPSTSDNEGKAEIDGDDFSYTMENLKSGTYYYVRTYLKIKEAPHLYYVSATKEFRTKSVSKPSFNSWYDDYLTLVEVTSSSFTVKGKLYNVGYPAATEVGFCWSTNKDVKPEEAENKKTATLGEDNTFTITVTDQTPGTIYYVYAYATNEAGTVYTPEYIEVSIKRTPADEDNTSPDK